MRFIVSLFVALWMWGGIVAQAQQTQQAPAPAAAEEELTENLVFSAPVVVDGEELFLVRGSSALPADERAAAVSLRIISVAESSEASSVAIKISDTDLGRTIFANGKMITVTTDADSEMEQIDMDVLSALHGQAIEEAILSYRANRSDDARVGSVVEALAWTAVFALVAGIVVKIRNWLPNRVGRIVEARVVGVQEATNDMVRGSAIASLVQYALRLLILLILIILLYYYLSFVLLSFAETQPFAELLITYVTDPILGIILGFISYLPNLLAIAVIAMLTRFLIKGARLFFENVEVGTITLKNFEATWIWPTFNIIRVILVLVAIVISFPYIPGSDSAAFQGLTILVGVMVSLGSNSVIANLLAGVFVIYRRSTNIGDRIKIGEHVGDVVQIKLMETHIKSIKNELISIPNAQLLNSEVTNYSSKIDGRGLLLHSTVGIGYEEPQDKVEAMLIEAARRTNGLKKSPEPFVLRTALADYAINYQINAYTTRGSSLPKMLSDLHRNIVDVFNENDVQIMTPSYEGDPEVPKIPQASWDGTLAGGKKAN
ncbi:MAG: mechanosensitive ion channel domain-containing protein [Paracoccaceae bacterium]